MIDYMLSQFDDAASHPDRQDLLKARIFAEEVQKKIKEQTKNNPMFNQAPEEPSKK